MNRIFIGGISAEGEHILKSYTDIFMPDAVIEPLQRVGIKTKIKRNGKNADVVLIILDEILYSEVESVASDVLALPKVHKYIDDDGLKQFLISKFGKIDISDDYVVPPDKLSNSVDMDLSKDFILEKEPEAITIPEEENSSDDEKIVELQDRLAQSEALVKQLISQLDEVKLESSNDNDNEVAVLLSRNKSLTQEIESLKEQLENTDLSNVDDSKLKSDLRTTREELADLQYQKSKIQIALDETTDELEQIKSEIKGVTEERDDLANQLQEITDKNKQYETQLNENATKLSELDILKEQVEGINALNNTISDLKEKLSSKELELRNLEVDYSTATADITDIKAKLVESENKIAEKEQEITELSNKNSELETKLEELQNQLNDLQESNDKLSSKLEEKRNAIQELKDSLSNAESMYSQELEGVSDKESEISQLKESITDLDNTINSLNNELETSKLKLSEKESEISELNAKVENLVQEGYEKSEQYSKLEKEYNSLNESLSNKDKELNNKIQELNTELKSKDEEINKLRTSDVSDKLDSANSELNKLRENLDSKEQELNELKNNIEDLTNTLNDKQNSVENLNNDIIEKEKCIQELNSELETKANRIAELEESLSNQEESMTTEIESLQSDIDKLATKDAEITQLRNTLEELTNSSKKLNEVINNKNEELKELQSNYDIINEELQVQKEANDKIIEMKNNASNKLIEVEESKVELEQLLESTKSELNTKLDEKNSEIAELEASNQKLKNKISNMEESVIDSKATEETIKRLESDILEERRKFARANSELEILRKLNDGDNLGELKLENKKLKLELEGLKSGENKSEEVEQLQGTIAKLQEQVINLKYDLEERDEISGGIFTDLANLALPKVAYDTTVAVPTEVPNGFRCITCGSYESNMYLYSLLKRTCIENSDKRILIIDLVTDSTIDRDFGTKKVTSPINWLSGSEPFTNFLANTQYKNVKVLTTALAYFNDLYLLEVDWKNRFKELEGYADIVFFNFGCLNNMVSKVLFNSFSNVMKSFVVVKSAPLSLRTSILTLTSIRSLSANVEVECVNFNEKYSQTLYQKLTQKYKTRILNDTDVLNI